MKSVVVTLVGLLVLPVILMAGFVGLWIIGDLVGLVPSSPFQPPRCKICFWDWKPPVTANVT